MTKRSGVYLLEFETGIKIGISKDVDSRLRNYLSPWCQKIQRGFFLECQNPKEVEDRLRKSLFDFKVAGSNEFFSCIRLERILKLLFKFRYYTGFNPKEPEIAFDKDRTFLDRPLHYYYKETFITLGLYYNKFALFHLINKQLPSSKVEYVVTKNEEINLIPIKRKRKKLRSPYFKGVKGSKHPLLT